MSGRSRDQIPASAVMFFPKDGNCEESGRQRRERKGEEAAIGKKVKREMKGKNSFFFVISNFFYKNFTGVSL